ncbi:MAG: Fe-S protein assembly co-chaperone HscB [Nitrospira sp.]|nr:Fe-S protein assembly co-chaperone HscB [Nitrospira sp.]
MNQQPPSKSRNVGMARSMCWHCQSELTGEYFCERCVKIQPVSKDTDYFTCLGLPRRLTIDPAVLEANYYERSRTFHPDFYLNKTEAERAISLANAATLNTAYRTLKDPVQRAEYLLDLEAGAVKTIRTSPPDDLFEEILELQEMLDTYRAEPPASEQNQQLLARLQHKRESLERRQQELEQELPQLFAEWDALQDQTPEDDQSRLERDRVLKRMREILSNRTYIKNILNDLIDSIG